MVWDGLIAYYLFLAGLGAGAFALAALAGFIRPDAVKLRTFGYVIAPIAVAVGTVLLMVDAKAGLMNPLRLFGLLANFSSIMAWGVVILVVFLIVSVIALVVMLTKKKTPKVLDIAGMVLAVCVAAYTGVLLGDAGVAFPLWNMAVLPVLFVVSAASTGIAAVLLVTYLVAPEEARALPFLPKAGLILPVVELALVIVLLAVTASTSGSAAAAGAASVANLVSGAYAVPFWLGFVAVGLVLPFVLELVRHRGAGAPKVATAADGEAAVAAGADGSAVATPSSGNALALVGEAGVLVGGFMLRYLVVMAALPLVLF